MAVFTSVIGVDTQPPTRQHCESTGHINADFGWMDALYMLGPQSPCAGLLLMTTQINSSSMMAMIMVITIMIMARTVVKTNSSIRLTVRSFATPSTSRCSSTYKRLERSCPQKVQLLYLICSWASWATVRSDAACTSCHCMN